MARLRIAGIDYPEEDMMLRLILRLGERVPKEHDMGMMATIGRLSDNMIDNLAVSSHHACVFRDATSLSSRTWKHEWQGRQRHA